MAATDRNTATYAVNLDDGTSGPAAEAVHALQALKDSIDKDTSSLREMQKAMKNLQNASTVDIAQYKQLKAGMDSASASIAKAQGAYIQLGGTFDKVIRKKPPKPEPIPVPDVPVGKYREIADLAREMPGPLGRMVGMFDKLARLVGGRLIAAGLIAIAAGLVALTVVTGRAITSLYSYAVAQGNARRSELLRLEGLGKLWTAVGAYYGLTSMAATDLQAGIDRVSASSATGRDQIARYGEQLYKMGLRGKNWESALEGMSMKASVQGDAQAQMFASWAAGLALTGGSVEKLTARVKAQIGGIAMAQMLDAEVQSQKLHENFSRMFATVKVEGLLKARASLYALFDQSTASGKALAGIMGRIVQPLINAVTAAYPIIKHFFQDMIIWELGVEISYLRMRNAFKRAFNKGEWKKLIDECSGPATSVIYALGAAALYFGVPALLALGDMAAAAAISMGALALETAIAAAPFLLVGAAIWGAIEIVKQLWDLFSEKIDFNLLWKQIKADVKAIKWGDVGLAMIEGIAEAIVPGPVLESIKSVAGSAVASLKSLLGIASPSKVFAALGETVPAGFAKGIDQGKPEVAGALGGMASMPRASSIPTGAPGADASGAGRGGAASVTIHELHVHAGDKSTARSLAQDIRLELERVLTDLALEMGAT